MKHFLIVDHDGNQDTMMADNLIHANTKAKEFNNTAEKKYHVFAIRELTKQETDMGFFFFKKEN